MNRNCRYLASAVAVFALAGLIAFVALPPFRHAVAVPIVGYYQVPSLMHIETPMERFHNWLAPPSPSVYTTIK